MHAKGGEAQHCIATAAQPSQGRVSLTVIEYIEETWGANDYIQLSLFYRFLINGIINKSN